MANFEDFLSNFPYPASYLASAHKDSSEGAYANKKKLSPMPLSHKKWGFDMMIVIVLLPYHFNLIMQYCGVDTFCHCQ